MVLWARRNVVKHRITANPYFPPAMQLHGVTAVPVAGQPCGDFPAKIRLQQRAAVSGRMDVKPTWRCVTKVRNKST